MIHHPRPPKTVTGPARSARSTEPVPNLRHLTTVELCQSNNTRLTEVILLKLESLDKRKFVDRQLTTKVRVLLELLRDSLTGRYPKLSVTAFAEVLLAMDYFIEVQDAIPDTWPRGYEDDLHRINRVWREFKAEIDQYISTAERRW